MKRSKQFRDLSWICQITSDKMKITKIIKCTLYFLYYFIFIKVFLKHFDEIIHNKSKNKIVICLRKVRAKEEWWRVWCHFCLVQNLMIRVSLWDVGNYWVSHSFSIPGNWNHCSYSLSRVYGTSWQNIL